MARPSIHGMFPKDLKGWATLIAFTVGGGVSGWLHAGGPDFSVLGVHAVLATLLGYLALVQVPAGAQRRIAELEAKLGPAVPRPPKTPPFPLATLMIVCAFGFPLACNKPIFPTITAIESTVAADLEAGDSDAQIASDVCRVMGGTALTDAVCGDVAVIVADAVTLLVDSGVLSAKGKTNGEALLFRLTHKAAR